jgi:DNA polymerase III alpha subunit (gram-positive type)
MEWNAPNARYRITQNDVTLNGEIVQIGAVKVNPDKELTVIDKFNRIIKPQVYRRMQRVVTELTDITDEVVQGGDPFTEVVKDFLEWCGEDFVFVSWSPNDIFQLEDNMQFYGLDIDGLPACYDMQVMFDDQVTMEGRDFALSYAMWKFGIKPEMSHDALNDAINTVEVMRRMDLSEGIEEYEV